MQKSKLILLAGGGLDSTAYLILHAHYGRKPDVMVWYNYGQQTAAQELKSVRYFARKYKVKLIERTIKFDYKSLPLVTGSAKSVRAVDDHVVVFPHRNLMFIANTLPIAYALKCKYIMLGFHKEPDNTFYDATPIFVNALNKFLHKFDTTFSVIAPLMDYNRNVILREAYKLDKELITRTYTCRSAVKCKTTLCGHCYQLNEFIEGLTSNPNEKVSGYKTFKNRNTFK